MLLYQIYKTDFDHSYDQNDTLPTSTIFVSKDKADDYVRENGGHVVKVETID